MEIWCAFSATDINNDHTLNNKELRMLLWIYEDDKPSEYRLLDAMKEMDKDQSGAIDRIEWVKYLCV